MRRGFATGRLLGVTLGALALGVFALVPGEVSAHGLEITNPVSPLVARSDVGK